ncbi:MAG: septum formation initiator family protein [Deltaproteobacteria bacterium]|nr:septum formation initiator family protein [Deltaproteobacteria bacterium]
MPSLSRKQVLSLATVVAALVAAVALLSEQGLPNHRRLANEADRLRQQNRVLREENRVRRDEIASLRGNRRYQEKVVREDLGYVKPGEQLYIVDTPAAGSAPRAAH